MSFYELCADKFYKDKLENKKLEESKKLDQKFESTIDTNNLKKDSANELNTINN